MLQLPCCLLLEIYLEKCVFAQYILALRDLLLPFILSPASGIDDLTVSLSCGLLLPQSMRVFLRFLQVALWVTFTKDISPPCIIVDNVSFKNQHMTFIIYSNHTSTPTLCTESHRQLKHLLIHKI